MHGTVAQDSCSAQSLGRVSQKSYLGEFHNLNKMIETNRCLNCDRPETVIPLVSLRYDGSQAWICSQCLPILIHKPGQLTGKLANADKITPVPPDNH